MLIKKAPDNPLECLLGRRLLQAPKQSLGYKGFRIQSRQGLATSISRAPSMSQAAVLAQGQVLKIRKPSFPSALSLPPPSYLPLPPNPPGFPLSTSQDKVLMDLGAPWAQEKFPKTMGTTGGSAARARGGQEHRASRARGHHCPVLGAEAHAVYVRLCGRAPVTAVFSEFQIWHWEGEGGCGALKFLFGDETFWK